MDMRKTQLPRVGSHLKHPALALAQPYLVAIIMVLVAAASGWWWFMGRGLPVTTTPVTRGTAAEIVYATGAIEPVRWAKVTTLIKGRIVERCRCEGQLIKAGHMLVRLDDAEAQATLRELKAREEFVRKEAERQSQLVTRGITSAQSYERAESEFRQIQALIAAQIERLANYQLLAPMDGIVLREDGEVGEVVDSNAILYRVGWPAPLQLVAEVNEADIPRVQTGQIVLLRSDAFSGEQLTGTVADITPAGDPVSKTYRIRVSLPDATPLRVGMSVEANVVTRQKENVLLAPAAAVVAGSVFLVEGTHATRRPIDIGIRGTQTVEVVSGLREGDQVISPAFADLRDGARVHVTGAAVVKK